MSASQRATLAHRKSIRRARQQRRRKIWAAVSSALLALPLMSTVFAPVVASAAPNLDIVVSDVELTTEEGGPLTVGDVLVVTGSWDASNADPKAGDTFTIGLPKELGFEQGIIFPLAGDGYTWANCVTNPANGVAECTLTDEVTDKPEQVKGTFEFEVEAVLVTTETEVEFDLNGEPVMVDLPGDGGIGDGIEIPDEWNKSGEMNSNNWSMTWTIDLPGSHMQGHDVVNIADSLGEGHALCEPAAVKVEMVRGNSKTDVSDIAEVIPEAGSNDFTIKLTAPEPDGFDPNHTYRIVYETCTPDGRIDPVDTEYTNEATVDIWGDDSSGIIGVNPEPWHGDLTKWGSVLGGGERNGKIAWTVTVPGDQLFEQDGFKFTETLGEGHEFCAQPVDIKITERYGPSNQLQSDVTGEFSRTDISSNAQDFEIDFDISDDSDFTFKKSDYRYVITYTTCVTQDGLPAGGTEYTNEVSVNGVVAGWTADVPGRSEGKSGAINSQPVTIDGTEHFPQTTLNWNVRVPGERLGEIDSDLIVTDKLEGAHMVCAPGDEAGGLASQLNLRVLAIDQINNGGLSQVDLTESVVITHENGVLKFSVPQPMLPLPDGSEATGFSAEYQYVFSYTTCTESGGMDAPGTTYSNSASVAGMTWSESVTQENRGSGTGTGVTRGSIAIAKALDEQSAGADLVADDTVFTVHVKEFAPGDVFVTEYDLEVPLNGDFINGMNPRGNGWTVELSEPEFPNVPGVTFGTPIFEVTESGDSVSSDSSIRVPLTPDTNIQVVVTNSAELGALEVNKTIDGAAAELVDGDQEFAITAKIDVSDLDGVPAQEDREFTVTAAEPFVLDNLPIGATVSFSETLPADDDVLTWGDAVITPESIVVTAEHATEPGVIAVQNHVERTVGTFTLAKEVVGDQADNPAVPAEVTVEATWNEEGETGSKTLTLPADGSSVPLGEDLLIGTEVRLTETPLTDGSSIAWGAPVWSGTGVTTDGETAVVTIGRDAEASVLLQNHAATSTAGLSFLKGISGEAADEVDSVTEFPITVTWTDAEGTLQTRELNINAEGPISLDEEIPAGTEVTITEGDSPNIDTVAWGSITISGSDVEDNSDGSATVVVSDLQNDVTLVTVTNEATWAPGTFSLSKEITGVLLDNPDVPDAVEVTATWLDVEGVEQAKQLELPTDGSPVAFGEKLPYLTEVTLSETPLEGSASFTWDAPTWSGDNVVAGEADSAVVTIAAGEEISVSLTNNATAILGSLDLTKALSGSGSDLVPANTSFPVIATWTDLLGNEQRAEVDLKVGAVRTIENLPFGVEVLLTEQEADLPDVVRWNGAAWETEDETVALQIHEDSAQASVIVTAESGSEVALSLTNDVDDTTPDTPWLPRTGAEILTAIAVGLLLVLAGVGLFRARRADK